MENASKALIIAGAILLAILIIGLGMFIYNQAADAMGNANLNSEQVQTYNSKFLNYEGRQSGSQVRALCDLIRNHNNANSNDTSLQIGLVYDGKGQQKDEGGIEASISYEQCTEVRNAIKAGETYTVTFTTAKSGKIINASIEKAKN